MALANERLGDGAAKLSKEDQDDLTALNAAVERMHNCTPPDPYLLTIPQWDESRYQHQYAFQSRQWLHNTPFDDSERESTQYQTFVWREQGKDMFTLKNSQPLDTVPSADTKGTTDMKGNEKAGTGANTPSAGAKKTITLDAYKKKQTGQTPDVTPAKELGQAVKKPAAKGAVERLKEDEELLAAVEEDESKAQKDAAAADEKKNLKRKREGSEETKATKERDKRQPPQDAPQDMTEPATKKMKPAPPSEQHVSSDEASKAVQPPTEPPKSQEQTSSPPTDEDELKLPPKLSPPQPSEDDKLLPKLSRPPQPSEDDKLPPKLFPPQQNSDEDTVPPLPARLSLPLPSNTETTLKAQSHLRSLSRSSDKSLSKDAAGRTLTPPPTQPAKKKSPAPRNGFRANSSSPAVRSDAEERGRPVTSVPKRMKSPDVDSAEESEEIAVSRKRKPVSGNPHSDNSQSKTSRPENATARDTESKDSTKLIVRLEFRKKSARDRLKSLLKMKPVPHKSIAAQSEASKTATARSGDRRNSSTKGVAQKVKPPGKTNGVSKRNDLLQSPPRKRNRSDNSDESDAPPTKRQRATTNASEPKRSGLTPPIRSNPISPPSVSKSTSQPSPGNLRKDALSVAMKRDLSTDSNMHTPNAMSQASPGKDASQPANGVIRPPSSQPSTKTPKQQAWEAEQKRLAKLGRELKHAEVVEPMRAAAISLESLLAFVLAFTCADEAALAADPKLPPPTQMWRSMQGYWGMVKKTCEPYPALFGVACYLGVVFNAHILNLTAQHSAEVSANKILETQAMMQRAANEAESKLDVDTLQSTFPRTWAGREKGALGHVKLEPGKGYKVSYKLPAGVQTSPLRAVRAGHAMLEEWLEKRGLDYALKLKL